MTSNLHHPKNRVAHPAWHLTARRRTKRARAVAFSLVEVTLALGIMGFAFVSILGLIPVGLNSFRDTKNVSVASLIAQQIFAEVQSTTFTELVNSNLQPGDDWRLPPPSSQTQSGSGGAPQTTTPLRCFDEQGQEISATDPTVATRTVYRVNVRVVFAPSFVQNAAGAATPAPNSALANVTIQIAYNPGNLVMDTQKTPTADLYLWTGKSGGSAAPGNNGGIVVPMFTYETLVARNF